MSVNIFVSLMMYGLRILAIIFILAATFTNFAHDDLNALAIVSLFFSVVNSFLTVGRATKKNSKNEST